MDYALTELKPLYEWHECHALKGGVLFPTYSSLQWFVRQHADELVDAKVLIRGKGGRAQPSDTGLWQGGLSPVFFSLETDT